MTPIRAWSATCTAHKSKSTILVLAIDGGSTFLVVSSVYSVHTDVGDALAFAEALARESDLPAVDIDTVDIRLNGAPLDGGI